MKTDIPFPAQFSYNANLKKNQMPSKILHLVPRFIIIIIFYFISEKFLKIESLYLKFYLHMYE